MSVAPSKLTWIFTLGSSLCGCKSFFHIVHLFGFSGIFFPIIIILLTSFFFFTPANAGDLSLNFESFLSILAALNIAVVWMTRLLLFFLLSAEYSMATISTMMFLIVKWDNKNVADNHNCTSFIRSTHILCYRTIWLVLEIKHAGTVTQAANNVTWKFNSPFCKQWLPGEELCSNIPPMRNTGIRSIGRRSSHIIIAAHVEGLGFLMAYQLWEFI